jgi:uncharacterized SAM-binding protein YcdF (DUF218 family)
VNDRARAELVDVTSLMLDHLATSDPLTEADVIWGLGSNDVSVAETSAELFHAGLAPAIVFSGGSGHRWTELTQTEADLFCSVAVDRGVPRDRIVVENRSTNTGENVAFSLEIVDRLGLDVRSAILITIPPFQLRAMATVKMHRESIRCVNRPVSWGEVASWDDERLIAAARLCVGEVRRLCDYPSRGFIRFDPSTIPRGVFDAARRADALLEAV